MHGVGTETIARLNRRIIPLFLVIYVVNFLDRVNIGFASLQMNGELGFGPAVYGLGAGIFFIGYFLFEVPSNMMLTRVGARYWLTRIMVTWGIVSAATAFVTTPTAFYVVRFLLGVTEAGFVPALLIYIDQWYPQSERASAVARIWSATAIAVIIGGPISSLLLLMDGIGGFAGWQWMFIVEALPAIILGVLLITMLTDRPEQAMWLTPEQRRWLADTLASEAADKQARGAATSFAAAFREPRVWVLSLLYFCLGIGFFGVTLWLPQIVKQLSGLSNVQVSLVTSIPFVAAVVAMLITGRLSDRSGERRRYVVGGTIVAAIGFTASGFAPHAVLALAAISIGAMGLWSVIGIFWQLPAAFLTGAAAAAGVAVINSCGSLGGFVGPYLIGLVRSSGVGFGPAMAFIGLAMLVAAGIAASLRVAEARV